MGQLIRAGGNFLNNTWKRNGIDLSWSLSKSIYGGVQRSKCPCTSVGMLHLCMKGAFQKETPRITTTMTRFCLSFILLSLVFSSSGLPSNCSADSYSPYDTVTLSSALTKFSQSLYQVKTSISSKLMKQYEFI